MRRYWVKITPSSCFMSFSSAGHATPRSFNSHTPFPLVSVALKLVEAHRGFLLQCKPHEIKLGEENVLNMWPWRRRFWTFNTAWEEETDWLPSTANNCIARILHSRIRKHGRILSDFVVYEYVWVKDNCYTSQLKYVFRLEENVSRVVGQNSLTP